MPLPRLFARWRGRVLRSAADRDLDDEIAFHIERETEKLVRSGVAPHDARRQALANFGGVQHTREAHRDVRALPWIEEFTRDARYAARGLARSRVFLVSAVVTLTLGIAASTIVVSAVRALLFPPLPVDRPDRLFSVFQYADRAFYPSTEMAQASYPGEYLTALRQASGDVFEDVGGYTYQGVSLRTGESARTLSAVIVTPNYFRLLGMRPTLGRFFTVDRRRPDQSEAEVVISYDLWQGAFAADSSIVGRTLHVDSRPVTVTGIAPRGFHGAFIGLVGEIWISSNVYRELPPTVTDSAERARRGEVHLTVFGRLRDGLTVAQAQAMLAMKKVNPMPGAGEAWAVKQSWRVRLDPLAGIPAVGRAAVAGFTAMFSILVMFVLLIVATNIAGMLLARATARRREMAIRLSIGASRGRIVRQLVTESVMLCLLGAGGGVLLARWLTTLLPAVRAPISVQVRLDLRIDPVVLGIAVVASVVTGVLAGLAPALQSTRFDVIGALRGAVDRGSRPGRMRTLFVVSQFAMSLVLLVTAGLFVRALQRALATDPGFDPRGVVVARVDLEPHGYDVARGRAFYARLMERLAARPEIASVGLGVWTPLSGSLSGSGVPLPGESGPNARRLDVHYGAVDSGYFATLGIRMIAGRPFTGADDDAATPVVIVNEPLARRMWPGESPLGRLIDVETGGNPLHPKPRQVIGVMSATKVQSLGEEPRAYAYLPFGQRRILSRLVYAKSRGEPQAALAAFRSVVQELDPDVALEQAAPLASHLDVYVLPQRMAAWFVSALGIVGLALAALGVYGMVSYHVAQRTREFGIRLALGARGRDVTTLAQHHAFVLAGAGAGIGIVVAAAVARLAAGILYGVPALDAVTFAGVSILLGAVAFVASWVPARRAAKVDPMVSLRSE